MESLDFFSKVVPGGGSMNKYFCTYLYDQVNAKKSARNIHCLPRVGSNAILRRRGQPAIVLRIQVCVEDYIYIYIIYMRVQISYTYIYIYIHICDFVIYIYTHIRIYMLYIYRRFFY